MPRTRSDVRLCRKHCFQSRPEAEAGLFRAMRLRRQGHLQRLEKRIYWCWQCDAWHLTSEELNS